MKHFFTSLFFLLLIAGARPLRAAGVYDIYPVPQKQIARQGRITLSPTVIVVCDASIDKATRERARQVLTEVGLKATFSETPGSGTQSVLFLGVNGSGGPADQYATQQDVDRSVLARDRKFDRHLLSLRTNGTRSELLVLGENSDATFFGLASLEQILEHGTSDLPAVDIFDYADQQSRGLVEGYYGYPYSVAVKKDLMRFMMRMKMNTYMYGAKSDVYHSQKWESPYPVSITEEQTKNGLLTQDMIRDITHTSQATKVNFIWAIHPGNNFVGDQRVVSRIMNKFSKMYDLGVRQFAVFVDDVGVPTSESDCKTNADHLTALQQAIDNKWNKTIDPEKNVRPLHFVPQVYTLSWVSADKRKLFYDALSKTPEKITIYITGWGVWTVPNGKDLAIVKNELKRPAAWWWNYPCNDNADGQLYLSDMYYNFYEMPAVDGNAKLPVALTNGLGVVANPMQEGEVSKIALFSVADYAWNNAGFDNSKSWNASFKMILSTQEKQEAYKTIIPYLRWNDATDMQRAITQFKSGKPAALSQLLDRLEPALQIVLALNASPIESERLLYKDLAPWALKLKSMLSIARGMSQAATTTDQEEKWKNYVRQLRPIAELENNESFTAFALEGMGSGINVSRRQSQPSNKFLYPFMNYLFENGMGKNPFGLSGKAGELLRSSNNIGASIGTDGNEIYINAAAAMIPAGGFLGFSLPEAVCPEGIEAADTLLQRHIIQYSADGKSWKRLTKKTWTEGDLLKYLIYINHTSSERKISLTRNNLRLLLPELPIASAVSVPTEEVGDASDNHFGKKAIIDGNPLSFFACKKNQAEGDTYAVTLKKAVNIRDVKVYFGTKNGDYLKAGKIEASPDGQHWTPLHVKGSSTQHGGLAQSSAYADDIRSVDFAGQVDNARFVRLTVTEPLTNKWLRLYDIQVNTQHYAQQFASTATDGEGNALPEVTDKKSYTGTTTARGAEIHYALRTLTPATSLHIYWDAAAWNAAAPTVEWTSDDQHWQNAGILSSPLTTIDTSVFSNLKSIRIRWNGTHVPAIYQIVCQTKDEIPTILPTAIQQYKTEQTQQKARDIYSLSGKRLRANGDLRHLPAGTYIVAGQRLILH